MEGYTLLVHEGNPYIFTINPKNCTRYNYIIDENNCKYFTRDFDIIKIEDINNNEYNFPNLQNEITKFERSFRTNKNIVKDELIDYLIKNKIKCDIVSEIKTYYECGTLKDVYFQNCGVIEGEKITYKENGDIYSICNYINGEKIDLKIFHNYKQNKMANYTTYEKNREIIKEYDTDGDIEYNYIKHITNREIYEDPQKHFKITTNIFGTVRIDGIPPYIFTKKETKYNKNGDIEYILNNLDRNISLKTIYEDKKIKQYVLYKYDKFIDESKYYYLLYLRNLNKLFFNN